MTCMIAAWWQAAGLSDWPVLRTRRRISRRCRINIKSCHATMDHLVWDRRLRDTSGAIVTPLPLVIVFAVSETFILVSVLIKSILLSTSSRPILLSCLRLLIAKCSFAVDKVVIKDAYLLTHLLPVRQRSIVVSVSVCLCVCLCIFRQHISGSTRPILTSCMHVISTTNCTKLQS